MYVSRPRPTLLYLRESISKYKGTKDLLLLRLLSQISNGSQDFFYGMFLVPALQNGAFGFYKSVYRLPYPFRVLILPSDFNYTRRFLAENNGNLCIKGYFTKVYSIKGVDLKICLGFVQQDSVVYKLYDYNCFSQANF